MKQAVLNVANRFGVFAVRTAPTARIADVLSTLRPVVTDRPLIRLGGKADGGYLVPDDLDGIEAIYSPGVDVVAEFERSFADRGIPCFLADASVSGPPITHPHFHFTPRFLGSTTDREFVTIDDWVAETRPDHGDSMLLQMDIESAEWPVLLGMSPKLLQSFRIIVLELHYFHYVFDGFGVGIIGAALKRLTQYFHVVHLHPNNSDPIARYGDLAVPKLLEVTLLRKDRCEVIGPAREFPHPLDIDNVASKPPIVLPASLHN